MTKQNTILIADDDFDLSQSLTLRCRQLGLDVFRSPDAMHALLGAHRAQPALILLDINMPAGNGMAVCEMLANDREVSGIPVIVMSGQADDEVAERCRQLGARYVQKGPQLWSRLEEMIRETLGLVAEPPPLIESPAPLTTDVIIPGRSKVLCIDDDPDISGALKLRLEPYGIEVGRAFSGMQGYWSCLDMQPRVIVSDLGMPDGDGNYIVYRLRSHPLTKSIPIIILTGQDNQAIRRQMLSLGVDAFLTKPLVFDQLLHELRQYIDVPRTPAARGNKTAGNDGLVITDSGLQAGKPQSAI